MNSEKKTWHMSSFACLITFMVSFALYIGNLSIPLFLINKFSASSLQLGIIGFSNSFFYTLFLFIVYKLKFKKNFPWFVIMCFLISAVYFFIPHAKTYYVFLFLISLNSIFYSRFWPSIQFFFAGINQTDKYNVFWSSGVLTGSFVSGYLFKIDENLPFFISACLALLGFLFGMYNFRKFLSFFKNLPEKFVAKKRLDTKFKRVLLANWISFFSLGGALFLFPKLSKELGYSSIMISTILGFLFTFRFLSFLLFSRFKMEVTEGKIFISYLISCISFIVTGFVKVPVLHIISISALGISTALSFKLVFSEIARKGYSTDLNELVIGAGWLTGPLFIGFLGQIFGITKGFISAGFFIISVYFLQRIFFSNQNKFEDQ